MKILLIKCLEDPFSTNPIHPPLGLQYLAASLEKNGHEVEIIDLRVEKNWRKTLKNSVLSTNIVGLNVQTQNLKYVLAVSNIIKELDPYIPLVIGGPHCIFSQFKSLNDIPNADISVTGEGEHVINDIVRFFQGFKKLSDINGIYYREKGRIKKGKPLKIIKNLDSINFPARHLVEKYDYGKINNFHMFKPKLTAMITSRGCPYKCNFCTRYNNIIKDWSFRQRSAENVVKEIIVIYDYN